MLSVPGYLTGHPDLVLLMLLQITNLEVKESEAIRGSKSEMLALVLKIPNTVKSCTWDICLALVIRHLIHQCYFRYVNPPVLR